jgi:hypothetical protein
MRKLRRIILKSRISKPPKTNLDQKTIQVLQQIATKLQLLINQYNSENKEANNLKSEPELKINVRLTTQKKRDITKESIKTLAITWKNDKYYANFIRRNLIDEKLIQK